MRAVETAASERAATVATTCGRTPDISGTRAAGSAPGAPPLLAEDAGGATDAFSAGASDEGAEARDVARAYERPRVYTSSVGPVPTACRRTSSPCPIES